METFWLNVLDWFFFVFQSYISYLIYRITTILPPQLLVDYATMIGAFLAFIISTYLNVRDWIAGKKKAREAFVHSK